MKFQELLSGLAGIRVQRCPNCDEIIESDAINIQEGVALCPACGVLSQLSELIRSGRSIDEILDQPPSGCELSSTGQSVTITASLRSVGGFLGAAFFALFWNGIVSIFVLLAVAGLYTNLVGPLPDWFPLPGVKQGQPQMNGHNMELGETLFLCIFLIPFVTVGFVMTLVALVNLFGTLVVFIDEFGSWVATGIGPFSWKRRFDANSVSAVRIGCTSLGKSNRSPNRIIELQADRPIRFGSMLRADRMDWLRAVLQELLVRRDSEWSRSNVPDLPWLTPRR